MRKVTTYLLTLLFSVLFMAHSWAQKTVSGKITDAEDGKSLPGATIRAGEIRGASTDKDGNFTLKNISENISILEISYIGYQTMKLDVPQSGENLDIKLVKSTYQADEVIINATRVNDKT